MALRDFIAHLLQVQRIKSPVDSVSGDDIVAIGTKLQYETLFPITEDGDIVYKAYITGGGNIGRLFSVSLDANGEYDFTSDSIREFPSVTIYDSSGNVTNYFFNNTTKKITGGTPLEAINVRFI